jgi:excinuclease ABC subunit C
MILNPSDIKSLPVSPGIYKFFDKLGKVLYIGKSRNLKIRVSSYFKRPFDLDESKKQMVTQITQIEIITVGSEFEALLLEADLIRTYKPKYNVIWKDDKHYIYIAITREEFPRVILSRRKNDHYAYYFGPFPASRVVREMLKYVRTIFPYCNQKLGKKACFYTHLGLCSPCPSYITGKTGEEYKYLRGQYLNNLRCIRLLLSGKSPSLRTELVSEMEKHAGNKDYEMAAVIRNRINNLDYLTQHFHQSFEYLDNPFLSDADTIQAGPGLVELLKPYFPAIQNLNRLECYDISNISGKFASGSLVTFIGGHPDKNYYRRFRIRGLSRPNDFLMLKEVLTRRLSHHEWGLPDIFIVDGGTPQLRVFNLVLKNMNITVPAIGLAKRYEEIVVNAEGKYRKIRLNRNDPSLRLIQNIRDEAHRFAHSYHEHLRLKFMFNKFDKQK